MSEAMMENKWGVPDWRVPDGYPPADASAAVWAWEFLRRSPDYRKFWKEKCEPFLEVIVPAGAPAKRGEPGTMTVLGRNAAGEHWPYHNEMQKTFNVDVWSPPDSSHPPRFWTEYVRSVPYAPSRDWDGAQGIMLAENEVAFIVDLSRPLKAQFDGARAVAKERQESAEVSLKAARKRTEFYVTYLRILDGLDSGESLARVADILFDDLPTKPSDENPRLRACQDARDAAIKKRDAGRKPS